MRIIRGQSFTSNHYDEARCDKSYMVKIDHVINAKVEVGIITNCRFQETRNDDPSCKKWIAENSLVMSWFLHSMQLHMTCGYMLLSTTQVVGLVAPQTYS